MMKILSTLVFLVSCNYCLAQYYAVNDKDSFVNVRNKPDINAAIICKLPNETIVLASYAEDESENSNWLHVDFYIPKKNSKKDPEDYTPAIMKGFTLMSGYIYKTKLTAIEKLSKLKYKQQKNGYHCYNDSVLIKVSISPFLLTKHKIKYNKDEVQIFEQIDNQPMIGSDGSKPASEIKEISFSVNNTSINIPPLTYKNLFNPSLQNDTYTNKKGTFYLVMYNSDAAGSFLYFYF
jgi:hypothetical protein